MKHLSLSWGLLVALIGAGCAPAVPTVDPAMIQASAIAAANTMIAMTQEAIPTPTDTPEPSPTPLPSPTLQPIPTLPEAPTTAPTSSTNDCYHLFDVASSGNARAKVLINNNTKGSATLSLGMWTKNAFGQCGYLGFGPIAKNSSITVSVPQTGTGPCWWAHAYVNDPKHQTQPDGGPMCMNNPDKWIIDINYESIRLTPP